MALLLPKESIMSLYLAPREGMIAPLNFGDDWTEIRCGVFVSGCYANDEAFNAGDAQAGFMNEDVENGVYFGLKNSDSAAIPGQADSLYLGVKPTGGLPFDNYSEWQAYSEGFPPVPITSIADPLFRMSACGYDGTDLVDGGIISAPSYSNGAIHFRKYTDSQGYCGFYVIRFIINNRGASNQSVSISIASKGVVEGIDYTPFALQQEMNNANFGSAKTVAWNDGGSARGIPDAFYIYMPFYSNRIMIAAMRAIKYQPA